MLLTGVCSMDRLMQDHLQGFVVIFDGVMSVVDVGMELLEAETDGKTFLGDVSVPGLNVGECLAGKGDGASILDEGCTKAILTVVCLSAWLGPVVVRVVFSSVEQFP